MSFDIITEWSTAAGAPDLIRETAAELTIKVEGQVLTQHFDDWSKTVTERVRVSVYPLAAWLANSWWRIRYEPAPEASGRPPPDWRVAHDLPAAGGGYVWPRVRIASDGEAIQISARAGHQARWEPGRYLTDLPITRIPQHVFDREVDGFLGLVSQRLSDMGANARPLQMLWEEVLQERADPEVRAWRELEARLGFFADEAPEFLMEKFASLSNRVGKEAINEIAPVIGARDSDSKLRQVLELAESEGVRGNSGLQEAKPNIGATTGKTPWERGRLLAAYARKQINVPSGPISNGTLCEILGIILDRFEGWSSRRDLPLSLGVRTRSRTCFNFHFRKRNTRGRRFEAARFIADLLMSSQSDDWLPQTNAATARQQIQRAFAAEFLVPIEELQIFLESMTTDVFEDAGEHFDVSPLTISSHLANHGLIPVESIWTGYA